MKAFPHSVFRRSQHSVEFELPNDVFYDLMALVKLVNTSLAKINGYKITPDDLICMGIEDFAERYLKDINSLLKRLNGK